MPHRIPYLIAYDITNTRTQARVRRTLRATPPAANNPSTTAG